jgi:hypothetical protein
MIKEGDKKETSIAKQRSAAYPGVPLEQAIELSSKLLSSYGSSPFSRDLGVQAFGYKKVTGDNAMKISALVHYGLLNREGNAYKNSSLAERIEHYVSEEDRKEAIIMAALHPKLFRSLVDSLQGKALPSLLSNILIREYSINKNVADKVADNFKKTLLYTGLSQNGVVSVNGLTLEEATETVKSPVGSPASLGGRASNPRLTGQKESGVDFVIPGELGLSLSQEMQSKAWRNKELRNKIEALYEAADAVAKEWEKITLDQNDTEVEN